MPKHPAAARARRATPPAPPEAPPTAPVLSLSPTPEPASADEQLSSLLAEYGGAGSFRVRIDRRDRSGEADYLGTLDLSPELLDDVKARWGGGKYRGRVVNARGGYERSITFGIAGVPRDAEAERQPAPAPAAEPAGLSRLEAMIAGMVESVRELARVVATPQPSRVTELKELAETLRALAPAVAPTAAAASDPLAMMNGLLELQSRMEDRAGRGGTDWGPLVGMGHSLVGVMEKQVDLNREAMLRRRSPALPAGGASSATVAVVGSLAQLAARIPSMARGYLARAAASNDDPAFNAELALRQLPPDVVDDLPALLAPDDAAAQLVAAVPEWRPYPAWFADLVREMRESLAGEADENADGEDAPATTGAPASRGAAE